MEYSIGMMFSGLVGILRYATRIEALVNRLFFRLYVVAGYVGFDKSRVDLDFFACPRL